MPSKTLPVGLLPLHPATNGRRISSNKHTESKRQLDDVLNCTYRKNIIELVEVYKLIHEKMNARGFFLNSKLGSELLLAVARDEGQRKTIGSMIETDSRLPIEENLIRRREESKLKWRRSTL
ncbi:hypothetical protein IEQ34_009289 [Dendrobium chrysotoxum]|uniref:Uncharacterized protein n=1 Tax=Dendrobium chrysotoxum TaxID=161865 RepID=A0AAV7GIU8_DENCH|nr:hypothetical protein IEQ34_009289 [Dendrobium chrysotoxum]